jgi:hypothetical protein
VVGAPRGAGPRASGVRRGRRFRGPAAVRDSG